MDALTMQILLALVWTVFLSAALMHLMKKNSTVVWLYAFESAAVSAILIIFSLESDSMGLLSVGLITFAVKSILAPALLWRLISKHGLKFTASTYLNLPVTLLVLLGITATARSSAFSPIAALSPEFAQFFPVALGAILVSMFLVVNRRGVLSQIAGVLSAENSIVAFVSFLQLRETLPLELGIVFDITVWIIIAVVFVTLILRHFGTLDVEALQELTEE